MINHRCLALGVPVLTLSCLSGCASYVAPGPAASLAQFGVIDQAQRDKLTDYEVRRRLDLQPLARFPVNLAVARVQGSGYESHTATSHGRGAYSVITTRDVETDDQYEKLGNLPLIQGVAPVTRLLLPEQLRSERDLREAAAALHADMLLVYTFDTEIYVGSNASPVDVVTLGFLPHQNARVVSTASAALLDTRNGYLYAAAEATAQEHRRANTWTSKSRVDETRRRTEADAFDQLVNQFAATWHGVVNQYAYRTTPLPHAVTVQPTPHIAPPGTRYDTATGR